MTYIKSSNALRVTLIIHACYTLPIKLNNSNVTHVNNNIHKWNNNK